MGVDLAVYPEAAVGGFTDIDGTVAFYSRINALVDSSSVAVDVGCGRGAHIEDPVRFRRELRALRGKAAQVIGLDVDPTGADNPFLDEFRLMTPGESWPLANESVDLLFADNVLEHVSDPGAFFGEAGRVVKTGGHIAIRTPNRWGYVAVISRLVPEMFHSLLLDRAQSCRREEDVFPAYYRCNTIPALRNALRKNGFVPVVYGYESEPSYLSFSRLAYRLGVMHQRWAPGFMKLALFAFGRKSGSEEC